MSLNLRLLTANSILFQFSSIGQLVCCEKEKGNCLSDQTWPPSSSTRNGSDPGLAVDVKWIVSVLGSCPSPPPTNSDPLPPPFPPEQVSTFALNFSLLLSKLKKFQKMAQTFFGTCLQSPSLVYLLTNMQVFLFFIGHHFSQRKVSRT